MARKRLTLALAALWLAAGVLLTSWGASRQPAGDRDAKLAAAQLMQAWMDAVKEYKLQSGLEISAGDLHQTGMIGEAYTLITTTHGALEAKRTTANPDMAALLVQMLTEAGVRSGDTVGAGFSGSFPSVNLAVLAACQVMGIKCVYIASVGASTYGANQPELTFPDMVLRLYGDGLLDTPPALITPGGADDCGLDMDPEVREEVLARVGGYGVPVMREPDFNQNIEKRMALYREQGPIRCFIGVGGNLTTAGTADTPLYGLIPAGRIRAADQDSGLVQRYNTQGIPVIHLLNIKKLTADYGLAYDPETPLPPGRSAVYYETRYPLWPAVLCGLGALGTLLTGFRRPRKPKAV